MPSLFLRQLRALIWKNWIVLSRSPFLTIVRALILPIAYAAFLATAQVFLNRLNNYGFGTPVPINTLDSQFDGHNILVWADATDGTSNPSPQAIIDRITANFSPVQLAAVKKVDNPADIPSHCPSNFNLFSQCFAALSFGAIPDDGRSINYTILGDGGLAFIDVEKHTSDFEKRILPLQWAVDKAIIELQTNVTQVTPTEWPYTQETNEDQLTSIRLSYIRGIRDLIALALFVTFVGISYQLPGAVAGERALLITEHMKAMGLLESARILSWHVGISLTYLPAWIVVGLIWKARIFVESNTALILFLHIILGLVLASYSFFTAAPFGKSPQLAAVVSTFLVIVFAILGLVIKSRRTGTLVIFSLLFPPTFYIFALKGIAGYESRQLPTDVLEKDPDDGIVVLPLIIAAVIDIFLWPYLAILWERHMYDARLPSSRPWWAFWRPKVAPLDPSMATMPPATAISVRNLTKIYKSSKLFSRTEDVMAVSNLNLDVPEKGIFVLLGSNGAGKSTSLSVMGGLSSLTSGAVLYSSGTSDSTNNAAPQGVLRPPRGTLGLVPQKNVLFPGLTCLQTLNVWRAVKWSASSPPDEDLEELLRDCDLSKKINSIADEMSGGQKRKLQLAIGLLGGSRVVLVDECTSGVDPLSRRAVWKTLMGYREDRCIIFTTHFLDEADLLADYIAILAAPGKVVAQGSPVALKRDLGEGYSIQVSFTPPPTISSPLDANGEKPPTSPIIDMTATRDAILQLIRPLAPQTYYTIPSLTQACYHLRVKDVRAVSKVMEVLDGQECKERFGVKGYDVIGTTVEDIFLDLMKKEERLRNNGAAGSKVVDEEKDSSDTLAGQNGSLALANIPGPSAPSPASSTPKLNEKLKTSLELATGRPVSPLLQALTIFHKRLLIFRRSWLTPLLTIAIAVCGACIPLVFIKGKSQSCTPTFRNVTTLPLFLPQSPFVPLVSFSDHTAVIQSPPEIIEDSLGRINIRTLRTVDTPDQAAFETYIRDNFKNLSLGGVSVDESTGEALFAWQATSPGLTGAEVLNMASNLLYNRALNASGIVGDGSTERVRTTILTRYGSFPRFAAGTLVSLRWIIFFGAAMAVYPAFYALYVSKERHSSVQAMQLSNGLTDPIGLWLGHLLYDTIWTVVLSTIIAIVFGVVASSNFNGLGFVWFILVLYGIAGALFAYCASLMTSSPLAAFATVAGYQFVMFILYLSSYLFVLTYAPPSEANRLNTIIHFTISVVAPVASITRAGLVSVNLFSLLCNGQEVIDTAALGSIKRFGGPILYLIVYSLVLLFILVWADSGSRLPRRLRVKQNAPYGQDSSNGAPGTASSSKEDILAAAEAAANSNDSLRVLNIKKRYGSNQVVDDISLSVGKDTVFALLGPNGAGKTTTFNIIRGDVVPESGDVIINGTSVVRNPKTARSSLGVCPQFTAIDSQLTVREHLLVYGRLKGLSRGPELNQSVEAILEGTSLDMYADRLASKLSGGNQRKLSLAIALIGNPSVVLIDEFSTGIDPKMKREMWHTLRKVAVGKAVVITTHSMEEASALASSVGIIAKRVLAVGTTESLSARYASYEVHFTCRTREEIVRARALMTSIPGSRMADDVATRFEVPIREGGNGLTLAELFNTLSKSGEFTEYTVEKATLESVFLKVIRGNNVREEDSERSGNQGSKPWWRIF